MSLQLLGRAGSVSACELPLFSSSVSAGFPSPADDFIEARLDLNRHLIEHPAATFFLRASGDSMINAGIYPGDMLVVDNLVEPRHDNIVIAALNGDMTVKRLFKQSGRMALLSENNAYPPIFIHDGLDFSVWGVVRYVIHAV